MSDSQCYQRATAYLTDDTGRLLVFDHVDAAAAGTQVPAGGILPYEEPEAAVLRELLEESGIGNALVIRKLGEAWCMAKPGTVPQGLEEQVQHAFHLRLEGTAASEPWLWDEKSGGDVTLHRFELRWVPLEEAAGLLWPIQAMWLEPLRLSLAQSESARGEGRTGLLQPGDATA
jgi:8-oxo-dGTP pyrophosphatase MutT (NUDIX family)